MPIIAVRIPQMGEGLQEARLVGFLKQPGDKVKRDEPIYQMETDKAVMDVESPYEGTLVRWTAEVDSVLPIGSAVAEMEVAEGVKEMEVHGGPAAASNTASTTAPSSGGISCVVGPARNAVVPPRTRAYAKQKGLSDADLATIPSATGKLMPADIDAFLASREVVAEAPSRRREGEGVGGKYEEVPLTTKQRVLSSRLTRSTQLVVPGTISVAARWSPIERLRQSYKEQGGEFQPSSFTMFAYAVAKAMADYPSFRSTLRGEDTVRTYAHANIGIAVALPGDELVTAVLEEADTLSWREFAELARRRIEEARAGKDQANESVTVTLTNMQNFGLRDAVPVLVAPAVGVLFLGEVYLGFAAESEGSEPERLVNLTLTFDHRLINGVGAANFLNAVRSNVEAIRSLVPLE